MQEPSPSETYETIASAIRYLRENARQQPDLDAVAAHVGLSPQHLQRVFSAWAGISPKRFLQFLTRDTPARCCADATMCSQRHMKAGYPAPAACMT